MKESTESAVELYQLKHCVKHVHTGAVQLPIVGIVILAGCIL